MVGVSGLGAGYVPDAGLVALMAVPRRCWPSPTDHTAGGRFRSTPARNDALHLASPLWQKVSRRSSPVSMLATHKSLLLMKEKKAGSAGQILGSIRGPEH